MEIVVHIKKVITKDKKLPLNRVVYLIELEQRKFFGLFKTKIDLNEYNNIPKKVYTKKCYELDDALWYARNKFKKYINKGFKDISYKYTVIDKRGE